MFQESTSAGQDQFVCKILNNKNNGTFLEIGSAWPIKYSNTYILENKLNWYGIGLEYKNTWKEEFSIIRPKTKLYVADVVTIDYKKLLQENNMSKNIDYLSFDIEAENGSTINALKRLDETALDEYKFSIITFEHDIYRGDFYNTRKLSREILNKRGYILTFPDVTNLGLDKRLSLGYIGSDPYEDWYLHPDLVDINFINKIKQPINERVSPFGNEGGLSWETILKLL